MHQKSLELMRDFVETHKIDSGTVLDIGSMDINGTYRGLFPPAVRYIGVDIAEGKNVDVIMGSEEWKEIKDADVAISGQTLEHVADIPGFMRSIYEALKDGGIVCLIAPSDGPVHEHPIWVGYFPPEKMTEIVEEAGFQVLECQASDALPFRDVRCIAVKLPPFQELESPRKRKTKKG